MFSIANTTYQSVIQSWGSKKGSGDNFARRIQANIDTNADVAVVVERGENLRIKAATETVRARATGANRRMGFLGGPHPL